MFRQDCTCPALLKSCKRHYPYGAVTLYGSTFQTIPVLLLQALAWSAFARRYLRSRIPDPEGSTTDDAFLSSG